MPEGRSTHCAYDIHYCPFALWSAIFEMSANCHSSAQSDVDPKMAVVCLRLKVLTWLLALTIRYTFTTLQRTQSKWVNDSEA